MLILTKPLFPVAGNIELVRLEAAFLSEIGAQATHGFEFGGAPAVDAAFSTEQRTDDVFDLFGMMAGFEVDEPVPA